jgi:hypothetical protein
MVNAVTLLEVPAHTTHDVVTAGPQAEHQPVDAEFARRIDTFNFAPRGTDSAAVGLLLADTYGGPLPDTETMYDQLTAARPTEDGLIEWSDNMRTELATYAEHPDLGIAELKRQRSIAKGKVKGATGHQVWAAQQFCDLFAPFMMNDTERAKRYGKNNGPEEIIIDSLDRAAGLFTGAEAWRHYKRENAFSFRTSRSTTEEPIRLTDKEAHESGAYTQRMQPGAVVKIPKHAQPLLKAAQAAKKNISPRGDLRCAIQVTDPHNPERTVSLGVVEADRKRLGTGARGEKQFVLVWLGKGNGMLTPRIFNGDPNNMPAAGHELTLQTEQSLFDTDPKEGRDKAEYTFEWKNGDLWVGLDDKSQTEILLQAASPFRRRRMLAAARRIARHTVGRFVASE